VKRATIILALSAMFAGACGGGNSSDTVLADVESIIFLQRQPRIGGMGDIFQYTSYDPGARIVTLTPPTADGVLEVVCCEQVPEFAEADIAWYDLDFAAERIVMSARLAQNERYQLFVYDIGSNEITQLPTPPDVHVVYPIWMPNDRIMFMTQDVVEEGAPQHVDEYERRVTTQLGTINADGSDYTLGARNLSHRVFPSMLSDGRVLLTQWDHLGPMNAGHLITINPDMTTAREVYGKEGSGVSNSYLKAVEVSPGRVITISTSRDGTLQAGALLDVRMGDVYPCADDPDANGVRYNGQDWDSDDLCANRAMSEANSSYRILTPQVPRGDDPSFSTIGRYYDAYPLTAKDYPTLLVSWADGPVDDETLGEAGLAPDWGIYLYDSERAARRPIYNTTEYSEFFARPFAPRTAPRSIQVSGTNQFSDEAVLMGSMNVYESSLRDVEPGSIFGVRILEGYSSEEGIPRDFGLTEHEGSASLGVAPIQPDGSWAALIPPNIPIHIQTIDRFAMSIVSQPVWISGNAGESRFCGGCHQDRAETTVIQPGITDAIAAGPVDMFTGLQERANRVSFDFSRDAIIGVPWGDDTNPGALQAIFDAKCVSCHNGVPGAANPSYDICDTETMECQTITFDLRGQEVSYGVGETIVSGYTASHLSIAGPDMMDLEEANPNIMIVGEIPTYAIPNQARNSLLIQKLNPPQLYPEVDTQQRAFDSSLIHPLDVGGQELTPDEYHALILAIDSGVQFYSRENAPGRQ